jgi:O-antigen/teichoic acid export membrane protein
MAGFSALAVASLPDPVLTHLFPQSYLTSHSLLPLTALLGFALGFLNLMTTFVQAGSDLRHATLAVGIGAVLMVACLVTGSRIRGVQGLAVGGCCATVAAGLLLVLLPSERPLFGRLLASRRMWQDIAYLVVCGGPLLILTNVAWLIWVAIGGCAVLIRSLPEFRNVMSRRVWAWRT